MSLTVKQITYNQQNKTYNIQIVYNRQRIVIEEVKGSKEDIENRLILADYFSSNLSDFVDYMKK